MDYGNGGLLDIDDARHMAAPGDRSRSTLAASGTNLRRSFTLRLRKCRGSGRPLRSQYDRGGWLILIMKNITAQRTNQITETDTDDFEREYVRLPSGIFMFHREVRPMKHEVLCGNRTAAKWKIVTV